VVLAIVIERRTLTCPGATAQRLGTPTSPRKAKRLHGLAPRRARGAAPVGRAGGPRATAGPESPHRPPDGSRGGAPDNTSLGDPINHVALFRRNIEGLEMRC